MSKKDKRRVVSLADKRTERNFWAMAEKMDAQLRQIEFARDDRFARATATARIAELMERFGPLLERVRDPLFEMIELSAILNGDDNDYMGSVGIAMGDLRHQRKLPELMAARRASLLSEFRRLDQLGYVRLPPKESKQS